MAKLQRHAPAPAGEAEEAKGLAERRALDEAERQEIKGEIARIQELLARTGRQGMGGRGMDSAMYDDYTVRFACTPSCMVEFRTLFEQQF